MVIWIDDDLAGVPFADGFVGFVFCCRDEVVERGLGAVAVTAEFGIGVFVVIQYLVLQAERAGFRVDINKIFYPAVGGIRGAELKFEVEGFIFLYGDNIAAAGRVTLLRIDG